MYSFATASSVNLDNFTNNNNIRPEAAVTSEPFQNVRLRHVLLHHATTRQKNRIAVVGRCLSLKMKVTQNSELNSHDLLLHLRSVKSAIVSVRVKQLF